MPPCNSEVASTRERALRRQRCIPKTRYGGGIFEKDSLVSGSAPDAVDQVSCRPDFAVCCYSGYLKPKDRDGISPGIQIPAKTPPIFLAHASDDRESYGGSIFEHNVFMYLALKRAGVPAELHVYATGDHDFGVRQNEKLPSSWPQLCVDWLRSQGLLTAGSGK